MKGLENCEKKEKKHLTTPLAESFYMYVSRAGIIFSNISIVVLVLGFASLLSALAYGMFYLLGFLLILCTIGLIFVLIPNYWQIITGGGELFAGFMEIITKLLPFLFPIGIVSAILSIIFLVLDKRNRNIPRIVISSIIVVITIAILLGIGG